MREFFSRLTKKQIVFGIIAIVSFILLLVITGFVENKKDILSDQQAASRWSEGKGIAQVSCFFTKGNEIDSDKVLEFQYQLNKFLQEASITTENENARLYIDAYSSSGSVGLKSDKVSLDCKAIGIGGDFFFFHPLELVSGSYFSGNDLMKDYILIDETTAWQLYGSNDIAGMTVMIQNVPHIISGVYKKEEGRFWDASGFNESIVFLSEESLALYGTGGGIVHYEVVMPNAVNDFAYTGVKEAFALDETKMIVVENTKRYSLEQLFMVLLDFGIRSMQSGAVQFPYWENYARGHEDIFAAVLRFQIILMIVLVTIILYAAIIGWRRKEWTVRSVVLILIEKIKSINIKQRILKRKDKSNIED